MTHRQIVCIIPANAHRYGHVMMKQLVFMLGLLLGSGVQAEIFKCQLESGKTVYQPTPCQSAAKQEIIEIKKTDPGKAAEAEAKLRAWNENFAQREAARIEAEKARQAERDRQASAEALQRSAEYQRQQAIQAKRQADALEQQNRQPTYPIYPPYPLYPYPGYPPQPPYRHDSKKEPPTARPNEIK
ncbi:MAG: DUF4124 domain-containing protein [Methylobacter sp.]|nr:DUF4124 domain-containing protein [Methylobacter sp.]MDP3056493.1 DUF4124 domain-containing protein [Methylobacter sp.]MDZ4221009.1 DUF4124 domain-containing protein [Methylobacter sp.]